MKITEVRVKLLGGRSDRLRAFCSITLEDEFVVHDLRVIEGRKGLFVAMPSRKLSDNCPHCSGKNHLRSKFCAECGGRLDETRGGDRDKFHVDVAHPIVPRCREVIQSTVLDAFKREAAMAPEGPAPSVEYDLDVLGAQEKAADYVGDESPGGGSSTQEPVEQYGEPEPFEASEFAGPVHEEPEPFEAPELAGSVQEEPEPYDAGAPDPDEDKDEDDEEADQEKKSGGFGEGIL